MHVGELALFLLTTLRIGLSFPHSPGRLKTTAPLRMSLGRLTQSTSAVELKKHEGELRLYSVLAAWPCWDAIVSGVEPTAVVFLNAHIDKLTFQY